MNSKHPKNSHPTLLNPRKLQLGLRALLAQVRRIEYHDMPTSKSAEVEWEGDQITLIKIDKSSVGDIEATIHELLHVFLEERFRAMGVDDEIEEVCVQALEEDLMEKINKSARTYNWWRDETHRRIK